VEDVRIRGRGWQAPAITVETLPDGIRLRLDDELDPEIWMELTLSAPCLCEYVMRVIAHRASCTKEELTMLAVLSAKMRGLG